MIFLCFPYSVYYLGKQKQYFIFSLLQGLISVIIILFLSILCHFPNTTCMSADRNLMKDNNSGPSQVAYNQTFRDIGVKRSHFILIQQQCLVSYIRYLIWASLFLDSTYENIVLRIYLRRGIIYNAHWNFHKKPYIQSLVNVLEEILQNLSCLRRKIILHQSFLYHDRDHCKIFTDKSNPDIHLYFSNDTILGKHRWSLYYVWIT